MPQDRAVRSSKHGLPGAMHELNAGCDRRKQNADAQAAFRAKRDDYIRTLEATGAAVAPCRENLAEADNCIL